jgi:F0F1-type ATP synthase membrane subunit b/b'
MTPEDIQMVINARDERFRKMEEKAEKEKETADKEHTETKKALKKVERELAKIRREAARTGMTEEEIAFVNSMEEIRAGFEKLIREIDEWNTAAGCIEPPTPRMLNSARLLVAYMKQRLGQIVING